MGAPRPPVSSPPVGHAALSTFRSRLTLEKVGTLGWPESKPGPASQTRSARPALPRAALGSLSTLELLSLCTRWGTDIPCQALGMGE